MPKQSVPPPGDAKHADSRVGSVLSDRYRLDALLGEGGMGRVYAAEHVMMRKKLAVKILHRELTMVPEVVARFEREAMAAANIEHPNVAAATDFGKLADGSVFMAMEFVEGRSLRDEIARGPLPTERALRIARQIASALGSAHALDIIHRDLKPENVMLVVKGAEPDFVKVLDFGIARVPIGDRGAVGGSPITKVGMVFGTPEYMAPEQALGQTVDARADLYALGVIAYEMLAGLRPFSSSSQTGILGQQLSRPAPTFAERAPGIAIPPAVEQVVLRLLARESAERFQSAEEVVGAFDGVLGAPAANAYLFTQLAGSAPRSLSGTGSIPDLGGTVGQLALGVSPDGGGAGSAPDGSSLQLVEVAAPFGAGPGGIEASSAPGGTLLVGSARDAMGSSPFVRPGARPEPGLGRRRWEPLEPILAALDAWRARLPPPLSQVPVLGYVGAFAALAFLVGVLMVALLPRASPRPGPASSSSTRAPAAITSAPDVEPRAALLAADEALAAAKQAGIDELQKLARAYPKDARPHIALAQALRSAKRYPEALESVRNALALDPQVAQNADIAAVLWVTSQDGASRDATFVLLEGPMGGKGAEIAYDLAVTAKVQATVRERAEQYLGTPAFQKAASPALKLAVKLHQARTCDAFHALLDEAATTGDERALVVLRRLTAVKGCKGKRGRKVDCWPCLRQDGKLTAAIEAITERGKGTPSAP